MKAKSSVLTIRVPRALKTRIERVADEQGALRIHQGDHGNGIGIVFQLPPQIKIEKAAIR